jgi:hypothetical protein
LSIKIIQAIAVVNHKMRGKLKIVSFVKLLVSCLT